MRVYIQNFKSIEALEINLNKINVIIGPPNTGKSNLLEALHLYGCIKTSYYFYQSTKKYIKPFFDIIRGFEESCSLFRDFEPNNVIKLEIKGFDKINISCKKEKEYDGLNRILFNGRPFPEFLVTETPNLPFVNLYRYEEFIKKRKETIKSDTLLFPDFSNLVYVLRDIQIRHKLIEIINESSLKNYGISIKELKSIEEGENLLIVDRDKLYYKLSKLELLPQSFQYLFLFTVAIVSNEVFSKENDETCIVLFEKPDSHMFPIFIEDFVEILRDNVKRTKVVLTTHNEATLIYMIDKINPEDLNVYGVLRGKEGYTEIVPIDIEKLRDKYIETGLGKFIRNIENIINEIKKD
ncbi:MAG: AAA family ATPase [Candidatus Aenigmatarchaeota archaeon]